MNRNNNLQKDTLNRDIKGTHRIKKSIFKIDFLAKKLSSNEKNLFYIFYLFFRVELFSSRLYYQLYHPIYIYISQG